MGLLSGALVLVAPLAALVSVDALAQGATTAGISGVVLDADSVGIGNATVTVTNTANGERWQTVTGGRGRYLVEYLSLGGPYSIEARAIGFRPTVRDGISTLAGAAVPGRFPAHANRTTARRGGREHAGPIRA